MLPKLKTILCATDFSERSNAAFHLACSLARDLEARVIVLHVAVQPVVVYGEGMVATLAEPEFEGLRQELDKLQSPEPNVAVERHLVEGDPAQEILHQAKLIPCDLIILGTHGRTGLNRLLLGSVAEQVMRKATCPVLTVREPWPPNPPEPQLRPQETEEMVLI